MRPIEEPVVTMEEGPGRMDESVARHPAFVQIGAYRSQGGHTPLYDSDFTHNAMITIRVSKSELHRNLGRDWHFGREEIMEIAMSEAQWATFVSSLNMGSGVPATLRQFNGEIIPGLPKPLSRANQFGEEVRKTLDSSIASLDKLAAAVEAMGLPKGKVAAIQSEISMARMQLHSNVPYAATMFDEHVETGIEKAKAEIHGYMTSVVQRAGLESLTGGVLPLAIEGPGDE